MKLKHAFTALIIIIVILGFLLTTVWSADSNKQQFYVAKSDKSLVGPIVDSDSKIHKIGTLWQRVTNFGHAGHTQYEGRMPSCDYPGGSGNSYLYLGGIWLTAKVDGVIHSSQVNSRNNEFSPLDSVHVITGPGAISEEDTYTRYYDVQVPLASGHIPLGVEVTERTYAWSESFRDDFIIYEYTVKNVGIDSNGDGYPDTPRDLKEFYFTYRLDADVSRVPGWPTEYRFECWDDLAASNANWDWFDFMPGWKSVDHGLTAADADSQMMFMWDGDHRNYPADNGQDDDTGNPGPDGTLQSPGFIGVRILKTEPASLKVSSFFQCHQHNDPATDQETYDRALKPKEFMPPITYGGKLYTHDYRAILSLGPLEILAAGDSVVVTLALGVGSDPVRGGVYSLAELIKNLRVAQLIVDADYQIASLAPPVADLQLKLYVENGLTKGVKVIWDDSPISHENFQGFKVWKSAGKTAAGNFDFKPLGLGTYIDTTGSTSWPPPAGEEPHKFQIIDRDIILGFDYYYAVQSFSKPLPEPFGRLETNILSNLKYICPANPVANSLDRVKVVPNPYVGSAVWNNAVPSDVDPWQHRLQFVNLPADANIKIFTLDGDFVDEITSGEIVRKTEDFLGTGSLSVAEWDLITRNNQEAAPGIYMFVVDSPSLGTKVGKFVVVR